MSDVVDWPAVARQRVVDAYEGVGSLAYEETYTVWFCYILGGWKALVSTIIEDDRYYEVTHNVNRNETYVDTYVKHSNVVVTQGGVSSDG